MGFGGACCVDCRTQYGLWRSLVSASVWGTEGPGFESRQPDHKKCRSRVYEPVGDSVATGSRPRRVRGSPLEGGFETLREGLVDGR